MHLQDNDVKLSDLETIAIVGRGTFGVVRLVCHKQNKEQKYAVKAINKNMAVRMKQQKSIQVPTQQQHAY